MNNLDWKRINILIDLALAEDVDSGDATTLSVVQQDISVIGNFIAKEKCTVAGLAVAEAVFKKINPLMKWTILAQDGSIVEKGSVIATVEGSARAILTGERTALNFLQRLSGIATTTTKYVREVAGTKTEILDTRKTTPGWRNLEKYAVAIGGGTNHRMGLYDRIMIKDNHREFAGLSGKNGLADAIKRAREIYPNLEIEVEADTLDDVKIALSQNPKYILLDNMSNEEMETAVMLCKGKTKLEASGGITLERIASIAKLGVDFISVGALTHSVKATDISLDIIPKYT